MTLMSTKPPLKAAEIVELGEVERLTAGIEIGNLKDESRVGWRPWTAAPERKAKGRKKAAAGKKNTAGKAKTAKKRARKSK